MTTDDADPFFYLDRAEKVLIGYAGASLVSDEAELLRGCLYALVAIACQLDKGGEAGL